MQIKANKDVREYKTEIFFGMNLRQLVFAGLAGGAALACWALLKGKLGMETISWMCILAAAPFGAFGFAHWHGMYLEQFLPALLRSRVLHRDTLYYHPDCPERDVVKAYLEEERKANKHAAKRKKG